MITYTLSDSFHSLHSFSPCHLKCMIDNHNKYRAIIGHFLTIKLQMDQNYYFTSIFQYPAWCEPHTLCKCLNKGWQSIIHLWKWHRFLEHRAISPDIFHPLFSDSWWCFWLTLGHFDKHWHRKDWFTVSEYKSSFETISCVSTMSWNPEKCLKQIMG